MMEKHKQNSQGQTLERFPQMRRTIETFKEIADYGEIRIEIIEKGREIDEEL